MAPAITADRLSKTFKVKVRDPGLKGALQALLKPRYRDVHAVAGRLIRPPIMFLDEPSLGLDVTAQGAIRRFLTQYRDRHGAAVLLTFHYMQDVTALASRVLIINRGRLLYDGALAALVARIAHTKRIELMLADGVTAEQLAAFGDVKEFRFPNAVLEVPREEAAATSARLLAQLPVADLSIEDPPIEDVIRVAFARGVAEDEA